MFVPTAPEDDAPERDVGERHLDAALFATLASIDDSRHVHEASGIGDDVHSYSGSLTGRNLYRVSELPAWFVSEYGFWTVGPQAEKFGDRGWPPTTVQMREWVSRLSFIGSTVGFAGMPDRYGSLARVGGRDRGLRRGAGQAPDRVVPHPSRRAVHGVPLALLGRLVGVCGRWARRRRARAEADLRSLAGRVPAGARDRAHGPLGLRTRNGAAAGVRGERHRPGVAGRGPVGAPRRVVGGDRPRSPGLPHRARVPRRRRARRGPRRARGARRLGDVHGRCAGRERRRPSARSRPRSPRGPRAPSRSTGATRPTSCTSTAPPPTRSPSPDSTVAHDPDPPQRRDRARARLRRVDRALAAVGSPSAPARCGSRATEHPARIGARGTSRRREPVPAPAGPPEPAGRGSSCACRQPATSSRSRPATGPTRTTRSGGSSCSPAPSRPTPDRTLVNGYDSWSYAGVRAASDAADSYWSTTLTTSRGALALQALTSERFATRVVVRRGDRRRRLGAHADPSPRRRDLGPRERPVGDDDRGRGRGGGRLRAGGRHRGRRPARRDRDGGRAPARPRLERTTRARLGVLVPLRDADQHRPPARERAAAARALRRPARVRPAPDRRRLAGGERRLVAARAVPGRLRRARRRGPPTRPPVRPVARAVHGGARRARLRDRPRGLVCGRRRVRRDPARPARSLGARRLAPGRRRPPPPARRVRPGLGRRHGEARLPLPGRAGGPAPRPVGHGHRGAPARSPRVRRAAR